MNKLFIEHPISELLKMVQKKKLSRVEIKEAAVENIKELNPTYYAWEVYQRGTWKQPELPAPMDSLVYPEALLKDIPVGVKDIYNTYDFPTEMGSPLWKGFTPGNDARAVFHLKRQGAVVIGKTVTAEFAVHALNKTLNPWDAEKTPGTSSSGSAVAVSLGMVPLATGSQTAGSIVRPASFCGIYGYKPSFGTIPRTGTLKTTDSLDTLGFFTIHLEDLRRAFDSMRVEGLGYPVSHAALSDESRQSKPRRKHWRIGFARTHTWRHALPYAKEAMKSFVERLAKEKDIAVAEVELPKSMERTHEIHETIYNKALSYYFSGEHKQSEFVSPIMNELIAKGNATTLAAYTKAIGDQMQCIYDVDDMFGAYDVLVSLSTAGEAPPRETFELPDPALMWTLAHLPVVSVPVFRSPSGMPFGMQVVARKYNDYLLLKFLDEIRSRELIPSKAGYFLG